MYIGEPDIYIFFNKWPNQGLYKRNYWTLPCVTTQSFHHTCIAKMIVQNINTLVVYWMIVQNINTLVVYWMVNEFPQRWAYICYISCVGKYTSDNIHFHFTDLLRKMTIWYDVLTTISTVTAALSAKAYSMTITHARTRPTYVYVVQCKARHASTCLPPTNVHTTENMTCV